MIFGPEKLVLWTGPGAIMVANGCFSSFQFVRFGSGRWTERSSEIDPISKQPERVPCARQHAPSSCFSLIKERACGAMGIVRCFQLRLN